MSDDSLFLLKADIRVADDILQTLAAHREEQSRSNLPLVEKISRHLFGILPNKCEPLLEGTFHLIYKLHYVDKKIILKIALELPGYTSPTFAKPVLLHQILQNQGIPIPAIYTPHQNAPSQYLAMEFIDGLPYAQFANSSHSFNHIVEQLGQKLATVHQIEVNGFGEIQIHFEPASFSIKANTLKWSDFIQSCLDEHLKICTQNDYLSSSDCNTSLSIFKELAPTLNHAKSRLLHGDLGPQNVLVKSDNSLCFIDWEDALGGDPLFDIAMWGSFMQNQNKLSYFIRGYYQHTPVPEDFYLKYFLYQYRILLAKTVHRYRFQYCRKDLISPSQRLKQALAQLREVIQ